MALDDEKYMAMAIEQAVKSELGTGISAEKFISKKKRSTAIPTTSRLLT